MINWLLEINIRYQILVDQFLIKKYQSEEENIERKNKVLMKRYLTLVGRSKRLITTRKLKILSTVYLLSTDGNPNLSV